MDLDVFKLFLNKESKKILEAAPVEKKGRPGKRVKATQPADNSNQKLRELLLDILAILNSRQPTAKAPQNPAAGMMGATVQDTESQRAQEAKIQEIHLKINVLQQAQHSQELVGTIFKNFEKHKPK